MHAHPHAPRATITADPANNALYGQFLVKSVYEALRASPAWNETLLIITYDGTDREPFGRGGLPPSVAGPLTLRATAF